MALLFMESFGIDSLTNIALGGRWDATNAGVGNSVSVSATGGPFNDYYLICSAAQPQNDAYLRKNLQAFFTTLYVGFHYRATTIGGKKTGILSFFDGVTQQVTFGDPGSGQFAFWRGQPITGTQLAISAYEVPLNSWIFVELLMVCNTSTGQVQCKVNGSDVISLTTGLNTAPSGANQFNSLFLGNNGITSDTSPGTTMNFSHYRHLDTTGAQNNTFLGPKRVFVFRPTGAGSFTTFTPLAGANWQEVSANPSTGDASYNSTAVVGNKDTFAHTAASGLTGISGVQVSAIRRIDTAGPNTDSVVLYDGTTEKDMTAIATPSTYQWNCAVQETEITGGAFPITNADVTNYQPGYKLVS